MVSEIRRWAQPVIEYGKGLAVAMGEVKGLSSISKFGNAPDFDTGDGFVTIWDGAEDNTSWENMVYDYSTTADIDSLSSSDAGDDQDIEIQGLDSNYDLITQTITLNGQTRVPLETNLIRVFRMINRSSTDTAGHIFCYVNVALTGGVPDTAANIRAIINADNNQTEMAVYTVPNGYRAYLFDWHASTAGGATSTTNVIKLMVRKSGEVFALKHKLSITQDGKGQFQFDFKVPLRFDAKTDIEVRGSTNQVASSLSAGFNIILVEEPS